MLLIQEFAPSILFSIPFFWGIWEFRQFRLQFQSFENKIDKICKNELDEYKLLEDTKDFIDNINSIFKISFLKKQK